MSLNDQQLILVSGVASGAGKTSLAVAVITYLHSKSSTAAVKLTVTHGERGCPHGGKSCNVCSALGGDYQIIESRNIIEQRGTDTARFVEAGADPVLWGITRDGAIADAWRQISVKVSASRFVVCESNTLAFAAKPALNLMIVDPTVSRRLWKPSATTLIASADLLIFNERGTEAQVRSTMDEIATLRNHGEVIKVRHPSQTIEVATALKHLDALV